MDAQLLTRAQVAALTGRTPGDVHRWATSRGITPARVPGRPGRHYPAAAVQAAHQRDTTIPADLRLRRFVARALIA